MIIKQNGESFIRLSSLYDAIQKPAIMAPFLGVMVPVIVRELTHTQIRSCGDFSLIETISDLISKDQKKASVDQMVQYSELQYKLLKKSLVSPSYDEIMSLNDYDVLRIESEKELKELEAILNEMPPGIEKTKLMLSYQTAVMNSQFLLPVDFVSYIVSYALGIEKSDIKEITEDMLFEAAWKAKKGKDNPSDHLLGNFTDFNKEDINGRAWIIYNQRTKK